MNPELLLVKIGGNVVDKPAVLEEFLREFTTLPHPKILVHGGGKLATELGHRLDIPTRMVEGRRVTDADMLQLVIMVYGGLINKQLVAQLQKFGCNALGMSGADANCIPATKRQHTDIDYGFVGDIDARYLRPEPLMELLRIGLTPVLCALTHDGKGSLLNTNADTIAASVAIALSRCYRVRLLFCFDKPGVLLDVNDPRTLLPSLNPSTYAELRQTGKIFEGMIPKLDNAFETLRQGVTEVALFQPVDLMSVAQRTGNSFTRILPE